MPGEQLADLGGLLALVALDVVADCEPGRGRHRLPAEVVDELRCDAAVRAVHDETRPLGRSAHAAAYALVAARTGVPNAETRHACQPSSARTRPRSECPCPCRSRAVETWESP